MAYRCRHCHDSVQRQSNLSGYQEHKPLQIYTAAHPYRQIYTPYYVTIEQTTLVDNYGPDKDKSYDDMIAYLLPDNDTQLESRIFTGKQTLTQASVGKSVNGFKNYYIVVWGFENGPTTSVTLSESFKPANPE